MYIDEKNMIDLLVMQFKYLTAILILSENNFLDQNWQFSNYMHKQT